MAAVTWQNLMGPRCLPAGLLQAKSPAHAPAPAPGKAPAPAPSALSAPARGLLQAKSPAHAPAPAPGKAPAPAPGALSAPARGEFKHQQHNLCGSMCNHLDHVRVSAVTLL